MSSKIIPVILSGGAGTRLWPLSRELYPKQFLPLAGSHTMIQETLLRLRGLADLAAPIIICNEDHRFLVAEQMRQIDCRPEAIILEPVGRNTAPAVAVAALHGEKADSIMLVLPADHVIRNHQAFHAAINCGLAAAEAGKLVTFGIVPTAPETGYGYIRSAKASAKAAAKASPQAETLAIEAFVEKPDHKTAEKYVKAGNYYWNSGMFMFKPSALLGELKKHAAKIAPACRKALAEGSSDSDFVRLEKASFAASPSISIDYAVMEKTSLGVMVPLDAGWNDVGSWAALADVNPSDAAGNVIDGDVLTCAVKNSCILASNRLVAAVGIEDHIIVETADAVLVAHKNRVQDVKHIVDQLRAAQRVEAVNHRRVNRPWGTYEAIDIAPRFQVKRITVNPGESLSSQMHYHRAEHWVVVSGTARITTGDKVIILSENQSTYIPLGQTHRLENPGRIPLELIEVQSGSYLGEDDIVRFEDVYNRS
ncbi:MAG: mannose-1-phosphate guanylyltransferase/mannose-6-phosphate isomerase [Candidatus Riflebacteria bacterium HGW-Riflebacteria-1]|jgi:mannose-1-phosphate guanylyltransferase/mannose-6-phosphate isomerase|nr:MAG: mannose-1-phosphate guanylyltransferase/mannose-6-phosphate isomerase [Candidatus Riflebacteria bacterium HGW-Riflebacteria-1]